MPRTAMRSSVLAGVVILALLALGAGPAGARGAVTKAATANAYTVTNLVSDQSGEAPTRDHHLVNAWGLAAGPTSPWWVANNGTGTSTLYRGDGSIVPLVVRVAGAPTGTVFNGGPNFVVTDGTNSGPSRLPVRHRERHDPWLEPRRAAAAAVHAGLHRSSTGATWTPSTRASPSPRPMQGDFLYATDFHNRRVDVFDGSSTWCYTGSFIDPDIPSGTRRSGSRTSAGTSSSRTPRSARRGDDVAATATASSTSTTRWAT